MAARKNKVAWRKDRITAEVDPATDRRIVDWPKVKGMTAAQVEELGEFERGIVGTTRAVIRMNKRAQGDEVPVPHKVNLALASAPTSIQAYYADADED